MYPSLITYMHYKRIVTGNHKCEIAGLENEKMLLLTKKNYSLDTLFAKLWIIRLHEWLKDLVAYINRTAVPLGVCCATIVWHFVSCHIRVPAELQHFYLLAVEGDICQWLLASCKIKTCSFSLPDVELPTNPSTFPRCSGGCIPQERKPKK